MESTTAIMEKQIMGIDQAMDAHDWRYLAGIKVSEFSNWTLTLWGGHEVRIMTSVAGAVKIQEASERGGDDALFTIRAGW